MCLSNPFSQDIFIFHTILHLSTFNPYTGSLRFCTKSLETTLEEEPSDNLQKLEFKQLPIKTTLQCGATRQHYPPTYRLKEMQWSYYHSQTLVCVQNSGSTQLKESTARHPEWNHGHRRSLLPSCKDRAAPRGAEGHQAMQGYPLHPPHISTASNTSTQSPQQHSRTTASKLQAPLNRGSQNGFIRILALIIIT